MNQVNKRRLLFGSVLILLFVVYLDVRTPSRISWRAENLDSLQVLSARGLVLQEVHGPDLWATRGFSIYRSRNGAPFQKITSIVPPFGRLWGGYSSTLRTYFGYQEVSEVFSPVDDLLVVFAAGEIHRIDLETGEDRVVYTMRYFGPGKGRGVLSTGMTVDDQGYFYYGEYPRPPLDPRSTVAIVRSVDQGRTWAPIFHFPAPLIKHIHSVQWDPYGQRLWVTTGDHNHESRIGFSLDRGQSFKWIGEESQTFRTVQLAFSESTVSWVTDTDKEQVRHVRWSRANGALCVSEFTFPSPGFYVQQLSGEQILATTAEGSPGLWLVSEHGRKCLFQWQGLTRQGKPHPAVRMPRFGSRNATHIYFNPLRTKAQSEIIYRIERNQLATDH